MYKILICLLFIDDLISICFTLATDVGAWRSLVAYYTGGVGGAGSNPAVPTRFLLKNKFSL